MTTIAYKDGIIAYDSRGSAGSLIISDTANKMQLIRGVRFFYLGDTSDFSRFNDIYFGECKNFKGLECSAIIIDNGILFGCGVDDEKGIYKVPVDINDSYSEGSGQSFAYTAMDMGATAKAAVKMAMKRDTCTGGRVRTFKVPK